MKEAGMKLALEFCFGSPHIQKLKKFDLKLLTKSVLNEGPPFFLMLPSVLKLITSCTEYFGDLVKNICQTVILYGSSIFIF